MKTAIKNHRTELMRLVANATLVYPLLVIGLLYGEYFLAWHSLGRPPLANGEDDPKYIDGSSWMRPLVFFAMYGLLPMTPLALISNIAYIVFFRPSAAQVSIRLYTLMASWFAMFVLLIGDPHNVLRWILD